MIKNLHSIENKKKGNYYKTFEEAQKALEKLKAIEKVKDYIKENFNYDPENWTDWRNTNETKYIIIYDYRKNRLDKNTSYSFKTYSSIGYLKTEEDCIKLIEEMKKELKLIYK